MRELSTIQQTYIETIHQLCETDSPARTKAIAEAIGVRMASATEVVQSLAASGLVDYRKRLGATLTPEGLEIAEELKKRHLVLAEFFRRIGCEDRMADEAACAVEHSINAEIAELLVKHLSASDAESGGVDASSVTGDVDIGDVVYLDSAAALPPSPRLLRAFVGHALAHPGNPESGHALGEEAAEALRKAGAKAADTLGAERYSVSWTASATDAINLAARCALPLPSRKKPVIATTAAEHAALEEALNALEAEIRFIPLREDGKIDLNVFEEILDDQVDLVAVHHVQNETGAIQDLLALGERIDELAPSATFLVDTVQSIGKLPIPWRSAGVDVGFAGGHKLGAPSGGMLLLNMDKPRLAADFFSNIARERSERHSLGRPDVPVALTLADAVIDAESKRAERFDNARGLNRQLREAIDAHFADKGFKALIPPEGTSPYITVFLLPPYQGEIVARALSDKGVMVSTKSACSAHKCTTSSALAAMGLSQKDARTAIRVSFGFDTPPSAIPRFISALEEVIANY